MLKYHSMYGSGFVTPENNIYYLGEDFYKYSGGIFKKSHYDNLF
jgi:hypothetical protein